MCGGNNNRVRAAVWVQWKVSYTYKVMSVKTAKYTGGGSGYRQNRHKRQVYQERGGSSGNAAGLSALGVQTNGVG